MYSHIKTGKNSDWVFVMLSLLVLTACSDPSGTPPEEVKYRDPFAEQTLSDVANAYHILVPEDPDPSQKFPLVIVLDAHGDGKMAVNKFYPAVRYIPCLVAGSDLVRNNFQGFENAVMQMIRDIHMKYPVDEQQIIIAGFSGGARMAYYFALNHPVKGVLMCGAGPGQQKPDCPVYTISGMGDFNFAEQYRHPDIQAFSDDRFTADYFHGVHDWPPTQQLSDALLFLLGDQNHLENLRQIRGQELIRLSDSLLESGEELMAWKALEKASKLSPNAQEKQRAVERGNSLLKNEDFLNTIKSIENDLKKESSLQQAYSQRMLTADFEWWKNELTVLDKMLETHTAGTRADHYLRVNGFIGILLYSVVNNMIHNDPGNPQLDVMLEAYAYAEPENPDPYYYMALHAYISGDLPSCISNLDHSMQLGFNDLEKLKKEFPENILEQVKERK